MTWLLLKYIKHPIGVNDKTQLPFLQQMEQHQNETKVSTVREGISNKLGITDMFRTESANLMGKDANMVSNKSYYAKHVI